MCGRAVRAVCASHCPSYVVRRGNAQRQSCRMAQSSRQLAIVLALCAFGATPAVRAANKSFLHGTALVNLRDSDRKLQNEAALQALEDPDTNALREWKNPESGHSGRAQSSGHYKSEDGLGCRKLKLWTQAKGIENQFAFPVCKTQDGAWFIASGKKLTPVK